MRKSSNQLHVAARLINVADSAELWSATYDRYHSTTNIRDIATEMVTNVVRVLKLSISDSALLRLEANLVRKLEAFRLYSRALSYPNNTMAGLNKHIELLNQAIAMDPSFAQAHAELAQTYLQSCEVLLPPKHAMTEARKNALRALELDGSLPLAHSTLAGVSRYDDWNGAEVESKRAIAADPRSAFAYGSYAGLLIERGRFEEAERVLKQAESIRTELPAHPRGLVLALLRRSAVRG